MKKKIVGVLGKLLLVLLLAGIGLWLDFDGMHATEMGDRAGHPVPFLVFMLPAVGLTLWEIAEIVWALIGKYFR